MTLPILLIFNVSKWKNNKKHWKIGIWRDCDVIVGRGKSRLGVGLLVRRWSLCVNFMTLALLVPEIQRGVRGAPPPPVTDWPKKPSLNRVKGSVCLLTPSCLLHHSHDSRCIEFPLSTVFCHKIHWYNFVGN